MGLKDLFVKGGGKGEESVGLTQEVLKAWIKTLPLLDLARSVVMLDAVLFRLSMSEHKDQSWYALLALLFEPIGSISRLAITKFQGDMATSKDSQRALIFFIRRLHLQLGAHCYGMLKINAHELDDNSKSQAAYYALQSYSLSILRSYQLSILLSKQAWLNFYDLYNTLSNESTEKLNQALTQNDTIYEYMSPLSAFSSAAILSILSPYKLNSNSLEEIYMLLNDTIDHEVLCNNPNANQEDYCFSLNHDRAPSMFEFFSEKKEDLIFINQKLALTKLQLIATQGFKVNKLLLDGLASIKVRLTERYTNSSSGQLILGIANSYRHIYGKFENLYDAQSNENKIFSYPDKESKNWPIIINVYKKAMFPTSLSSTDEKPMSWQVVDQSSQGIGIISQESYPMAALSVGNFVQFNNHSNNGWISGLIRWISVKEGGLISLGLEYLAKENIPVYLQSINQQRKGYKSSAILGKGTFDSWPSMILITQGLSYRAGEELSLISEQNTIDIKLKDCLVSNKNCKIFSFKPTEALIN